MNDWDCKISELAQKADSAIQMNNMTELHTLIKEIKKLLCSEEETIKKSKRYLLYYLSVIYHCLGVHDKDKWGSDNYSQAIIAHRQVYKYSDEPDELFAKVKVNHANLLAELGRVFEAIYLWKEGVLQPGEAEEVGLYRLASCLLNMSLFLYDEDDVLYYQLYAKYYLNKLTERKVFYRPDIEDVIVGEFSLFMSHSFGEVGCISDMPALHQHSEYTERERKYRVWCRENVMLLNPLNDLDLEHVYEDSLVFPTYTTRVNEGPYFSASFSSMKNEFCYFRYLFYEGVVGEYELFTNDGKFLTDTLDGVIYDGYIEKIKNSLRGCFSVLDKISRLLDKYYGLGSDKIAFNRNWFQNNRGLKEDGNMFINALFWLSKDFTQHDSAEARPSYWLEESAFEVRELRNELEHGWVRVVDNSFKSYSDWERAHDYAYIVTEDQLIEKATYVFKQTRNALMYLCLAINFAEKDKFNNTDEVFLQVEVPLV